MRNPKKNLKLGTSSRNDLEKNLKLRFNLSKSHLKYVYRKLKLPHKLSLARWSSSRADSRLPSSRADSRWSSSRADSKKQTSNHQQLIAMKVRLPKSDINLNITNMHNNNVISISRAKNENAKNLDMPNNNISPRPLLMKLSPSSKFQPKFSSKPKR